MAHPKRRFSHSRTGKKRTHKKFKAGVFSSCPQCKRPKLAHRICTFCGYYNTRSIVKIKEKKKKQKR